MADVDAVVERAALALVDLHAPNLLGEEGRARLAAGYEADARAVLDAAGYADLVDEVDLGSALGVMQARILTDVVTAVRGPAPRGVMWSHHDAADLVRGLVAERDELREAAAELGTDLASMAESGAVNLDTWPAARALVDSQGRGDDSDDEPGGGA